MSGATLFHKEIQSPVGKLKLVAEDASLVAVLWERERSDRVKIGASKREPRHPMLLEAGRQLEQYFAGERTAFALPFHLRGTEFQLKVWRALREIPFGQTRSYRELAEALGSSPRAVGSANGKNPLSIIIPCHRLIGSDGSLTGFAGGLGAKAVLLAFERKRAAAIHRSPAAPAAIP
jgi:methylated-DNA-[protein]-cysteine S-methyltransferase